MSVGSFFGSIGHAIAGVFGSVVPKIGTTAGIAGGIIGIFNPAMGAFVSKIGTLITGAEAMYTTAKQGAAKKQTVSQIALAELPQLEEIIAQFGANPKIPEAELSHAIDAGVAFFNASGAFLKAMEAANAKPAA